MKDAMAALIVKGDTVGQKQRNYNILVNEAIQNNPTQQLAPLNYEDSDLFNLFKIDIACNTRNVEYILDVLKCEDMLYVSRVIKQSTWLITDEQYSYIINPEYLHNQLHPHMTSKAFNKLILHIRLNLKDEKRVEEFFNYYEKRDLEISLKWLLHCSVPFTENIIRQHANDIPMHLLERLYAKSFTILEILLRNYTTYDVIDHLIMPGRFLLNRDLEKFLDITESRILVGSLSFGPKYTSRVMEKNPTRVMKNLEKYAELLDIPTFAKYLRKEDVMDFILNHIKNEKTRFLFSYKVIKYFLNRLPFEERFDFVNKFFIEKSYRDENISKETLDKIVEDCNLPVKFNLSSTKNIWSWYVYAPFDKAFGDLKQFIRKESNPIDRIWIFHTMLTCAGSDQKNIHTTLKYYYENHMSEPFIFKVQFVNHLVTMTDTHKYDEESLRYLTDLYNSLELSTRSKGVETCVKSIILHSVIRGEEIPEIMENKFNIEYFIRYEYNDCKHKYNTEEREKIFNYFYIYYISKITNDITSEEHFDEVVGILVKVLELLEKWDKDLKDYEFILQKIKEFTTIKKQYSCKCDLSAIYHFKKSWRRLLFPESIILNPTQDTCINALKHDPELLEDYRKDINSSINNGVSFNRFLKKIRIDWHRSLADSFKTTFKENLNQKSSHKTSIKGLCTLLSQNELFEFVQKYEPKEAKIARKDAIDDLLISIRKHIATYMHLARPHPPLNVALLYAKGDYLQYMLPSLNAIFYNISSTHICENLKDLLNTPVSLQKHAIRVAFSKINDHKELKNIFSELWKSSKNRSIRKDIFCETYKMLCREKDETIILEVWELLSTFIDTLNYDENKKIYLTLSKVKKIPLSVRAAFWMKSYELLKKAPAILNCQRLIEDLNLNMNDIMEFLDTDLMRTIFFENFDKKFSAQRYDHSRKLALYLLSTKSESVQRERNEKIFVPLVDKAVAMWDRQHENSYYVRNTLRDIFDYMSKEFEDLVLKKEMVFPIAMYIDFLNKLQTTLSIRENYALLTYVKLSLGYIKILYDLKTKCDDSKDKLEKSEEFTNLYKDAAPVFGRLCLDYLKDDVENNFSSIYKIFAHVLNRILYRYIQRDSNMFRLSVLKSFLDSKDFIEGHLLLMELIPRYNYYTKDDERILKQDILKEVSLHPSEEIAMHYWFARKDDENE